MHSKKSRAAPLEQVAPVAARQVRLKSAARPENSFSETLDRKGIQSIEIGYRLLHALQVSDRPMSLTALAQATGMTPSKCHFYLASFIRVGLITQKEAGGVYDLGPSTLRLGLAALERVDALQEARKAMYQLRNELQQTVVLSVWGNRGPTIVYKEDGARWSPLSVRVGTVLPVLSATGLVLLSGLNRSAIHELLSDEWQSTPDDSPWKVASVEELHAMIDKVRTRRIAKGRGNIFPGYSGICSPIFDYEGSVCAALMVMGEIPQFDRDENGPNALALRRAAARASQRIGWNGDAEV